MLNLYAAMRMMTLMGRPWGARAFVLISTVHTVYALGCEEVERDNKDCFSENAQSWQRQEPGHMKCEVSQDHSQHASGGIAALLQLVGFVYDSK